MQFSSALIALMAAAPLALAAPVAITKRDVGNTFIHNNCDFDMTVNPCAAGSDDGFTTIPQGTTWSQPQKNFGGFGQGVSLKVNTVNGDLNNVAQFEYTVNDFMNLVFYDLSLINGNPFQQYAQNLTTGNGAGPDVACESGESPCVAAYTVWDQADTKAAPGGTDLHYYVCGQKN